MSFLMSLTFRLTFHLRLQNHLRSHLIFCYRIDFQRLCQLLRLAPWASLLLLGGSSMMTWSWTRPSFGMVRFFGRRHRPLAGCCWCPTTAGWHPAATSRSCCSGRNMTADHPSIQPASSSGTGCTIGAAQRSTGRGFFTGTGAGRRSFTPHDTATDWHSSPSNAAPDLLRHTRLAASCQLSQRAR